MDIKTTSQEKSSNQENIINKQSQVDDNSTDEKGELKIDQENHEDSSTSIKAKEQTARSSEEKQSGKPPISPIPSNHGNINKGSQNFSGGSHSSRSSKESNEVDKAPVGFF